MQDARTVSIAFSIGISGCIATKSHWIISAMEVVTEIEASRDLSAVLDAVKLGETIVITRDGHPIAAIGPLRKGSGLALKAMFACRQGTLDDDFEADIRSALEYLDDEIRNPWDD